MIGLAAPVALKPNVGFTANNACANEGTCCPEDKSICNIGQDDHLDYYRKAEGSCGTGGPGGGECKVCDLGTKDNVCNGIKTLYCATE